MSNILVASKKGFSLNYIKDNFLSKNDILKQISKFTNDVEIFEFDRVYNELHK